MSILNPHPHQTTAGIFSPITTTAPYNKHKNPPFFLFFSTKPITLSSSSSSSQQQLYTNNNQQQQQQEEEEHVIGDCLVFEEGIFEDENPSNNINNNNNKIIQEEDLIPSNWKDVQAEINITKKERRKLAQDMEFGSKLRKKKPIPIGYQSAKQYKAAKLRELNPIVLDNPPLTTTTTIDDNNNDNDTDEVEVIKPTRLPPKNPKMAVYGRSLDDISTFFNSGLYNSDAAQAARKLFTKEEKLLMNRRVPNLAAATSPKWQPLHTVAASGEFYLVDTLMKFNQDINVSDKDGLMAIHKAILGKKHAICNYLLRNSANPFVLDKNGATLMHYAVRSASTQMIKVLLLYNVDINLQDNDGWTPLHLAIQTCRTDVVRLLLIKKADQTLKNKVIPLILCLFFKHVVHIIYYHKSNVVPTEFNSFVVFKKDPLGNSKSNLSAWVYQPLAPLNFGNNLCVEDDCMYYNDFDGF